MAMAPNDPFENPNAPNAASQDAAPKKSGKGCLLGCGIVGILGVLLCCGGGVFMLQFIFGVYADVVEQKLQGNPVVIEHVGELESVEFSWSATIDAASEAKPGEKPLVFELEGSKGAAQVLTVQDTESGELDVQLPVLILPDGTRIPLELDQEEELEDLDMDLGDLIDAGDVSFSPPIDTPSGEVLETVKP